MKRACTRAICPPARRVRGQALVPVLFVVVILTAFAVTLAGSARREIRAAETFMRDTQAYFLERGAVEYAAAELQQSTNGGLTQAQVTPPPDTDGNGWTSAGDGWFKLDLIDTAARVNINTAEQAALSRLPALQANPDAVSAILDWRDADDNPSGASGAESDYYQSLTPPYRAKNAPFDTVEELLLVRGITPDLLYNPVTSQAPTQTGTGTTRQAGTDGGSMPLGASNNENGLSLYEMLTTFSKERNVASDGTPRVNVTSASAQDLQKIGFTAQSAQQIVQFRQQGGQLTSVADLLNIPGSGITRQLMQQFGDRVTVTNAAFREGVININTAPAEVFATIPGVDQTIIDAVIQARQGGTVFNGLNDLFGLTSLSRQQLQALLDHVCTKSSVYLVRVRVRMQGTPRTYAAQALVELSAAQGETGAGGAATNGGSTAGNTGDTGGNDDAPKVWQWREVPRAYGWSRWATAAH